MSKPSRVRAHRNWVSRCPNCGYQLVSEKGSDRDPETITKEFQQWIRMELAARGMALSELAREMGYSPSTFNQWVNGTYPRPLGMDDKIRAALIAIPTDEDMS